MEPLRVDLVALRRPVEVQFPDGQWFPVEPFRGPGKALLRRWQDEPTNGALLMELLHMAVPGATDADFDTLSVDEDVPRVIATADGKAALIELARKNGLSGGARKVPSPPPSTTPHSNPTTTSPTPAPESEPPTRKSGKRSTKTIGTTPSLPSTG